MRTRKRVLSLFLSLVLVLLSAAPAFARAAAVSTPTPVIFLAGFGTELYLNDGTPEEKGVLMGALNTDDIFGALGEAVGTGLRDPLSALCSPSPTADVLSAFLMNWMGPLACDENGDSVYPVSNSSRNDRGQDGFYGNRPFYEFHFDWRLDPMEIAGELRDFIQMVKEETGSEKVNLYALSFGSVICCAYLEQYGAQDLESLFLCVSAHGGLVLAEDLIVKQLAVSGKGLAAFLAEMLRDETGQLSLVLSIMEYAGMFNVLEWLLNKALDAIRDRLYERAIVPLLAQMPAVWAFITDDEIYENAKAALLADTEKYAGLIGKIDAYHYSVGNRANEILKLAASEIKLGLVCGYDCAPIPVGKTFLYQSDFLVATAGASGGAVCADYGKTLPADYVQAVPCGHGHISPDRVIDASACALPEQTWFIKGYRHQYEYSGGGIYPWFLAFDGQPTVFSDAGYPQFR